MSNVGRLLYGYCGGVFGRDAYDNRRIEAEGYDWIVTRPTDTLSPPEQARPVFASFEGPTEKARLIAEWTKASG